ncbi:hypothetical protein [Streptomyces sp. NPDC060366]|uniref:hypothetical protein n=1 Tax=Streptomyces sp. NPDC060366 TaxID=3347105 RepID=UPI00365A2BD6
MAHSKAELAEVAKRRAELIRLRRQGIRFEDERIQSLGYTSRQSASKDFIRALEERRDDQAAEASIYRQEENERLDALLEAIWPRATEPTPVYKDGEEVGAEIDLKAVDTVLKLMDRRAKLMGLDMPQRTELSGPDGGAVPFGTGSLDELNALIGYAGQSSLTRATNEEDAGGNTDG